MENTTLRDSVPSHSINAGAHLILKFVEDECSAAVMDIQAKLDASNNLYMDELRRRTLVEEELRSAKAELLQLNAFIASCNPFAAFVPTVS